jgi:endonuclease/exonuclease/phosphatase family metal-dependent hydrolase
MKLISLNIEKDKHYDKIFSFFRNEDPDCICLQEVEEEDFEMLKEKMGMSGFFKAFSYEKSPHDCYKTNYGKRQGVAIFGKKIIQTGYIFYSGKEENLDVPFEEYLQRYDSLKSCVLVWADIETEDKGVVRVVTTHFPVTYQGESSPYQLGLLLPFFEALDTLGDFVLCGDFNAPRGNETFTRLAARYTDCIPLHYTTSIDQNLHREKGIQFMVDGLFLTGAYTAQEVELVDGVSDHMAVIATIYKS